MRPPSPQLALRVTVVASRTLRWSALAFALLLGAAAAAILTGHARSVRHPQLTAAILIAGNLSLIHTAARPGKACPLDVSGPGALRLTVQRDGSPSVVAVQLLAGSTLWPRLLVLRLQAEGGAVHTLLVLPDSVPAGQFRPLAVALRAIAARAD
ncbi:hypothetical protein E4L96_18435 [Massilia arenosa]|uniref:Flagellar hook-length control protein n=1 Tax=Zemynaea arenosa TaxID=2561931 RepID=A0A4Y9S5R3_9BURK|nr:protein YgfX [Massilia arenosa]TFW15386.1 hypothetical protein E4L96_18435 [Massilia arenosa]